MGYLGEKKIYIYICSCLGYGVLISNKGGLCWACEVDLILSASNHAAVGQVPTRGCQFEPAQDLHQGQLSCLISWVTWGGGLGNLVSRTSENHPNSRVTVQRENQCQLEEA